MSKYEKISYYLSNEDSRNDVRMKVIDLFSIEKPGTGKGDDASRYIYYVETLKSGKRVYLQRPAFLHNGFDFLVCVENTNYAKEGFRKRNYPKHEDLAEDLILKREHNPAMYSRLYGLLKKVYECHDVTDVEMSSVHFDVGLPVDHILKTFKWLFIEQDIRYWNYAGRSMTWNIIPKG